MEQLLAGPQCDLSPTFTASVIIAEARLYVSLRDWLSLALLLEHQHGHVRRPQAGIPPCRHGEGTQTLMWNKTRGLQLRLYYQSVEYSSKLSGRDISQSFSVCHFQSVNKGQSNSVSHFHSVSLFVSVSFSELFLFNFSQCQKVNFIL